MSILRIAAPALAIGVMLSACTSYRGADRISDDLHFSRNTHWDDPTGKTKSLSAARAFGLRQIFLNDLGDAWKMRRAGGAPATAANRLLVNSGVALIQVNCNEYFNEMGRNQRNSAILRDLIAPVTAAINTAISLNLFSDAEDTNERIQLGFGAISAAGTSALDIYDRRFLFDSDNIASVRSNTMNALSTNAQATIDSPPSDFVQVLFRLQQVENYCTPAEILNNVRASLKTTKFKNEPSKETPEVVVPTPPATTVSKPDDAAFIETTPQ